MVILMVWYSGHIITVPTSPTLAYGKGLTNVNFISEIITHLSRVTMTCILFVSLSLSPVLGCFMADRLNKTGLINQASWGLNYLRLNL
jgi:hypothetical protein